MQPRVWPHERLQNACISVLTMQQAPASGIATFWQSFWPVSLWTSWREDHAKSCQSQHSHEDAQHQRQEYWRNVHVLVIYVATMWAFWCSRIRSQNVVLPKHEDAQQHRPAYGGWRTLCIVVIHVRLCKYSRSPILCVLFCFFFFSSSKSWFCCLLWIDKARAFVVLRITSFKYCLFWGDAVEGDT